MTKHILNILLMPSYTYIGAAVASCLSAIVLVGVGLPHVYQLTAFRWKQLAWKFFLFSVAAATMGILLWVAQTQLPNTKLMLLVEMIIGGMVYALVSLAIRAVRISEVKSLWHILRPSRS